VKRPEAIRRLNCLYHTARVIALRLECCLAVSIAMGDT
jgi:hypothetical protein